MKKVFFLLAFIISVSSSVRSQIIFKEPLSARQTYYKIGARLDVTEKCINGDIVIFWVNKYNKYYCVSSNSTYYYCNECFTSGN